MDAKEAKLKLEQNIPLLAQKELEEIYSLISRQCELGKSNVYFLVKHKENIQILKQKGFRVESSNAYTIASDPSWGTQIFWNEEEKPKKVLIEKPTKTKFFNSIFPW